MRGIVAVDAPQQLAVIGQGYVGLPLVMLAVEASYEVVGIDLDHSRVDRSRRSDSYVDDVDDAELGDALESGRYTASADYADLITVPTPLQDRSPDLSFVTSVVSERASYVARGSVVVLESTTYPGAADDPLRPILERGSGLRAGADFALGYGPRGTRAVPFGHSQ